MVILVRDEPQKNRQIQKKIPEQKIVPVEEHESDVTYVMLKSSSEMRMDTHS
jgi:hypothetical protein